MYSPSGITAAMGIFRRLPFNLNSRVTNLQTILVWDVSGSVGNYAVQLAKLIGLKAIEVAGACSAVAKIAGADVVIDYIRGQTLVQITEALNGEKLKYSFDVVSENGTTKQLVTLFDPSTKDARIVLVLYPSDELPEFIVYPQTSVFLCYGKELRIGRILPGGPEDKKFAEEFFQKLEEWLKEGKIKPNKITIVPSGLTGVSEGLSRMNEREISGEKLVYKIVETPRL
jgi:NADPH:quinone reductase